jgi:hypothetical protein
VLFLSRLIAALANAGAAFLFGLALGQRGELGVVQLVFAVTIPLSAVILAIFAKRDGRAYVVATGLAMLAGQQMGQRQFATAWEDCTVRAESVRAALLATDGDYPARLEELPMTLPCRAGFRTTILHYLSNDRGFRLWYTNDRERHVATDRRPFTASGRSSAPPATTAPSRRAD